MRTEWSRWIVPTVLAAALALPVACSETGNAGPEKQEAAAEPDTWQRVKEMYEQAKKSGEQVPGDVMDWAKEEIRKVGAFEYRVVVLPAYPPAPIEEKLNELGADRWECFHVGNRGPDERRLYCKRPVRSWLRAIPLRELVRLIPTGGDAGGD